MAIYRTLYIDMNSFFASVEQLLDPALRGKPVGITAMENGTGCIVAASYDAKSFGVRTGTKVYEARRLCPAIIFRPSRHRLYVHFNQKIADTVDQIAEVERIRSIDEFQVALTGPSSELHHAIQLAHKIKQAILEQVGAQLKCSVGIGPNPLLAKIAGKLIKPDGLEWLGPENMPARISHLSLDDLPGISKGILMRLHRAGIHNIEELYGIAPRHARMIWNSVEGERFVRALKCEFIPLGETKRNSYGNSKVLAPSYRVRSKAHLVGRWLIEKAAERLRRDQYCTRTVGLAVRFVYSGYWSSQCRCFTTQDTAQILHIYERLWREMITHVKHTKKISSLSVHLSSLLPLQERNGDLFHSHLPGATSAREKLAIAVDQLNQKYKTRVIKYGIHQDHPGFFERE